MRSDYLGAFALLENDEGVLLVSNTRTINGQPRAVWDLPGGGVEPGEALHEALTREMFEETGLAVTVGEMVLLAEGERVRGGQRVGVWRSVFFRVRADGQSVDTSRDPDILDHRFASRDALPELLDAPYHGAFVRWLQSGERARYGFDVW